MKDINSFTQTFEILCEAVTKTKQRAVIELGVGSKPIAKKNLTVDKLSKAIKFALQPKIVEAANQLGQSMRTENGNAKAVEIIHSYMTDK